MDWLKVGKSFKPLKTPKKDKNEKKDCAFSMILGDTDQHDRADGVREGENLLCCDLFVSQSAVYQRGKDCRECQR